MSELEARYSVNETNIYKWINQYSTKPNIEMKDVNDEAYSADDIMKMKSQIKSLQEDNEILKKVMTIFATK